MEEDKITNLAVYGLIDAISQYTESRLGKSGVLDAESLKAIGVVADTMASIWEKEFPEEALTVRKFITGLNALGFDTSAEAKEIGELEKETEELLQVVKRWQVDFEKHFTKGLPQLASEAEKVMGQFSGLEKRWAGFKKGIDRRVLDAFTLISQTRKTVRSDALYRLFTEEP